jgi:hypothetical protein
MRIIHDCLNKQFQLYGILNRDIIQYLENNNLNINYYCTVQINIDKIQYIVTSNTIKNKEEGYRLIMINRDRDDNDIDNKIIQTGDLLNIFYNNMKINISNPMQIAYINNQLYHYGLQIRDGKYDDIIDHKLFFNKVYDKNIDASEFTALKTFGNMFGNNAFSFIRSFNNVSILYIEINYYKFIKLPNLEILNLEGNWQRPCKFNFVKGDFPKNLKILRFRGCNRLFCKPYAIPLNLHTLDLDLWFNLPLEPNILPHNLHTLNFGELYDIKFEQNILPPNLRVLTLGKWYRQQFEPNILPPNLRVLTLGK